MIKLNDSASLTRAVSRDDLKAAPTLTDQPPPERVSLPQVFGLFSCLLGETLPGRGTNYLKQTGALLEQVAAGTPLTATVTVTRLRPEKHLVDLRTVCHDDQGRLLCDGRALVLASHVFETNHA